MKKIIIGIISICFFSACSAIFEKSIKDSSIIIYTPADSFSTKTYAQQFYWEVVSGATSYRLQIASPSFASGKIQSIVLDTIISKNKITVLLHPGKYEWRLRAQNGGSETAYFTRVLYVIQTVFNERPISVSLPASSSSTYTSSVSFVWQPVSGAMNYYIEVDTLSGGFSKPLVIKQVDASQTQSGVTLPKRGAYNWRMHATDSSSSPEKSLYSDMGRIDFKLDTVSLGAPINNKTGVSTSQVFTWNAPSNSIATDKYTYKFYLLNSTNIADVVDASTYPMVLTDTKTPTINNLVKGQVYYWTVVVYDQFNVKSDVPKLYKFTVTQ